MLSCRTKTNPRLNKKRTFTNIIEMQISKVKEIIKKIKRVKVAVCGDFCLDAYWILDPGESEISEETGLKSEAVKSHYYSLGGASNVVANLVALSPSSIVVIGVIGDDIFGREIKRQFKDLGVNTDNLIVQKENYSTITFGKRYLEDKEKPRIDFGFFSVRSKDTDDLILAGIKEALNSTNVLIFNQQVPGSITNYYFIKKVNELFKNNQDKIVILDTRHYGKDIKYIYRKINVLEAARLNNENPKRGDVVSLEDLKIYGKNLYKMFKKPVFITMGSKGMAVFDSQGFYQVLGLNLIKKLDTVGAGDTVSSALALCLASGEDPRSAAEFANLAAAVVTQKLFKTGTAFPEEILEISKDIDYIFQPDLAEDKNLAKYIDSSDIEICYDLKSIPLGKIKHVVFDHDSTVSLLRQGWECVMESMMIKSILGKKYSTADRNLYFKVKNHVREYIDSSTGIQSILQMDALVEMVKDYGLVNKDKILDKFGYKKIYNKKLMEMVDKRIVKFKNGELDIGDLTIKGAISFLEALKKRGLKLYLASGTDYEDTLNEAKILGYSDLFDGGIYGALGDISKYSKKMVISKIMSDNDLSGPELAVFGDGPVEIRECCKRKGISIGVASDEIRRVGVDFKKRKRLIEAGVHFIIPDFSQYKKLLKLLFIK